MSTTHILEQTKVRSRGRVLSTTLFIVAAGVLTQAAFAGLFISGTGVARQFHLWTGVMLPYFALVPTFSAWTNRRRGQVTGRVAAWTTLLMFALWVQEALGHMPFAVTTAIHVPLGVSLFAGSLLLAIAARRSGA
ncbi:MAG TPA: hypothetical protein VF377_16660 [Acidimicrobiia bacterium]|jgi:hypothetical protein